ncbi:4,5-DOPA dioxygenase extradiol [Croceicoccus gelatinilyticus]|uniref:4,5-DOPA-extradiol-dioxygenase n=1 Tax=Croceicoccus gelatinilyticus TaxID=2835536 RepID=UPI001BCD6BA6|nr:4,5-DOPA dioxygenase extradiol [Croceicoccus gelatinilyticus]MBS7668711.1 4,5-DOPA dioxygenase extradiol [Croceicoccus gelatinilyticus]
MPTLFIGHGSPMNALETNAYTEAWKAMGETLPRPRAVLVISAHWFIGSTVVTAMPDPRTIHDFYGFPQALFDVQYPAPGDPHLAEEVAELAKPDWVGGDKDQWGIDHGTWSVLTHMYPNADVPVVQLSLNSLKPLDYHVKLAARLADLRNQGVLILASGNVVHNLRLLDWNRPDGAFDWAQRFDEAAEELLTNNPGDVLKLVEHPDYPRAVPSPDHFLPLLYTAGLAAGNGPLKAFVKGTTFGSISMTSYSSGPVV